jgi:hypothetical protein
MREGYLMVEVSNDVDVIESSRCSNGGTVLVTTSPTQLGFPRNLVRNLKEFFLGRKPMKRMRLPQYYIFFPRVSLFSTQIKVFLVFYTPLLEPAYGFHNT